MKDANRAEPVRVAQQSQTDLGDQAAVEAEASHAELAQALQDRPEESHDGPFRGFGSPPGRF